MEYLTQKLLLPFGESGRALGLQNARFLWRSFPIGPQPHSRQRRLMEMETARADDVAVDFGAAIRNETRRTREFGASPAGSRNLRIVHSW